MSFLAPGEIDEDENLILTRTEVKAIYRIIEHEWINRDDLEAMTVADRISRFVNKEK